MKLGTERAIVALTLQFNRMQISNEEIQHFKKLFKDQPPSIDQALLERLYQPLSATQTEDLLDEINIALIETKIDLKSRWLSIDKLGLTRLPAKLFEDPTLQTYWEKLTDLSCSNNRIKIIPKTIVNLKKLTYLSLDGNKIESLPGELSELPELRTLYVVDNFLQTFPEHSRAFNQWTEIQHFQDIIQVLEMNQMYGPAESEQEWQRRDALLEDENERLIRSRINLSSTLDISNLGLTRFPTRLFEDDSLRDYWRKLATLYYHKNWLPPLPEQINHLAVFKAEEDPKETTQQAEIEHFKKLFQANPSSIDPTLLRKLDQSLSLAEIEQLLDDINIALIKPRIKPEKDWLKINDLGLTRLPAKLFEDETRKDYWESLRILDCKNNRIKIIPNIIGKLRKLFQLRLEGNQIESLPDIFNEFPILNHISVEDNFLKTMPDSAYQKFRAAGCNSLLKQQQDLPESAELRQWREIQHFQKIYQKAEPKRGLLEPLYELSSPAENAESYQQRETLLEDINMAIIERKIDPASTTLDVSNCGLTRFPVELFDFADLQDYWKKLKSLDCHGNWLRSLPKQLNDLVALEDVNCLGNCLQALPETFENLVIKNHYLCYIHNHKIDKKHQKPIDSMLPSLKSLCAVHNPLKLFEEQVTRRFKALTMTPAS